MKKQAAKLIFISSVVFAAIFAWHLAAQTTPLSRALGPLKAAAGDVHYSPLSILGDPVVKGVSDPSIANTPDGRVGWLAYSYVTGNGNIVWGRISLGEYVSTHLARTTDGGATWIFVKALNVSTDGRCVLPSGQVRQGVWRYEVPSLVCDPTDPDPDRRWKLFVHRYFWDRDGVSSPQHGWIVLRTAADPAGPWSGEIPLFGAGANPPAPYHKTLVDLNSLDPVLAGSVAYTEPGALAYDGRLYLALTSLHPQLTLSGIGVGCTIVLLVSDDHAASWKLAGTLLKPEDASRFGYQYFDGADLAEDDGHVYLLAVPGSRQALMYDGCVAFEFDSLPEGRLRRDANGNPVVANYFPLQPNILSGPGGGQATYDPHDAKGGLMISQFNLKAYPDVFRIYQTGQKIDRVEPMNP